MPEDLKIFDLVGGNQTLVGSVWPGSSRVDGQYSLVQKITKCLLSAPGESEYDPDYGADIRRAIRGVSGQEVSRARKLVSASLSKVLEDLGDDTPTDPEQQLLDLRLVSLEYDQLATSWIVLLEVDTAATTFRFTPGV